MKAAGMTSMERVLTALSHKEPDRVPMFLLLSLHGAKELGMTIKDYFSRAENVAEGQIRLREKFKHDCYYAFFYAALETEAFGEEVNYMEDGPPNSALPCITDIEKIRSLQAPTVRDSKMLHRVLKAITLLKEKSQNEVPVIGVAISPFSLPVMQLGFDKYLELMLYRPDLFEMLMEVNEAFCIDWANAQLQAGATAICYFDPVSSTTIISPELYQQTGYRVARQTLPMIKGPTATHFASGFCLPIVDAVAQTGTAAIGISSMENLSELKHACRNRLTLIGNLNGIEMRRWSEDQAREQVMTAIRIAATGGGFILSDNHGEIPWQVSDRVLHVIAETVMQCGRYPILQQ